MSTSRERRQSQKWRFLALLLAALGAVLLLCALLYRREMAQSEQRLRDRETVNVGLLSRIAQSDLHSVVDDLQLLVDGDGLRDYLESGGPAALDRAVHRAQFFSLHQPNYDQVRYLDENGHEIIRVNQGGQVVRSSDLQNKAHRLYFQTALSLTPGQIHVSAFDLNAENGLVEQPFKPVMRFAAPVFDLGGRQRGVCVINFLGQQLFSDLRQALEGSGQRLRILNAQGYWLKAATRAQEWGFMFSGRTDATMARLDPALWQKISGSRGGQLRANGGLFTWQRIAPGELIGEAAERVVADDAFLIIASEVSAEEWTDRVAGIKRIFLIVTPALMLLAASSLAFLHSRRKAVEALRESEQSLAVTLNSIGDGVMATDTLGRVTRLNRVAAQLTGWTDEQAEGRPVAEIFYIINEQTRNPAVIPVEDVLATGRIQGLANHTILISRDGTERAIADSAAPIKDAGGRITGVVLVFRDVSEERAVELKIEAARNQLDRFFTLSLDFLCISSADGYFKRVSPAVTDILGWSSEEFLKRPYLDYIHPDDHAATIREVERQVVKKEKVLHFENRYRHNDGSWRTLSWRSVPQPDGLMYAIARDVTDARRTEAEVHRLNEDLQRHATKLESANKELEAFSYSVSHDLRAPLRHVQGYVDMLSRETQATLSEKGQRYLKTIAEAGRNMGQLIDNLLSFSRMGRSEMHEGAVDLNALVQETLRLPEIAVTDRKILWKIAVLPMALGDHAMLRQVFSNLLGNAVKYTRSRDPAEIEIGRAPDEDGRLVVFVRDNGAGFDMQYAGKLFGVFQRLHRADEFEGTGIGLANVRRIIARHGGRTWAEGKPDAGATFYFTLQPANSAAPSSTDPQNT